jgi:hypothetical protein
MMESKVKMLQQFKEETHIKAYNFIVRMAKANLQINSSRNKPEPGAHNSDVKLFEEMHIALEQLGLNKDNDDETNRSRDTVRIRKMQSNTDVLLGFNKGAEEEFFLDKFDTIEDLSEYYKYMMSLKRVEDFKKYMDAKFRIQAKSLDEQMTSYNK